MSLSGKRVNYNLFQGYNFNEILDEAENNDLEYQPIHLWIVFTFQRLRKV